MTLSEECWAGTKAFFGGRWTGVVCHEVGDNVILHEGYNRAEDRPKFCDAHMKELIDAGMITHPNIGVGETDNEKIPDMIWMPPL
jgi:hypothetical protein